MNITLPALSLAASTVVLIILFILLRRIKPVGREESERAIRDEFRTSREEASRQARELREEIANAQAKANEALMQILKTATVAEMQPLLRCGLMHKWAQG